MTPNMFVFSDLPGLQTGYPPFSPLVLADRLITLAQEADRAGYHSSASRLISMVYAVLDDERIDEAA